MINLLPSKYKQHQQINQGELFKLIAITIALLLLVTAVSFYLNLSFELKGLAEKIDITDNKIDQVENWNNDLDQLQKRTEELRDSLIKRKEMIAPQINASEVLVELEDIVFSGVWIQNFIITEQNKFYLIGYSLEQQKLNQLVNNLNNNKKFADLFINYTEKNSLEDEYSVTEVINYSISGIVNDKFILNYEDSITYDEESLQEVIF